LGIMSVVNVVFLVVLGVSLVLWSLDGYVAVLAVLIVAVFRFNSQTGYLYERYALQCRFQCVDFEGVFACEISP